MSDYDNWHTPELIAVSVVNSDRDRDFTPTASSKGLNGQENNNNKKIGGGAKTFRRFLAEELIPIK